MWSPHIGHLVGRVTPCAPSFGLPAKQNVQFQRRAEDCPPYQHAKEGRIRDAGRQCLRSPVSPAPTLPRPTTLVPDQPSRPAMSSLNPLQRVRASHTADIKLGLKVKRLVKAAAGEVVGGKIFANFWRVSIAYIIAYSCMQRFTVADRW